MGAYRRGYKPFLSPTLLTPDHRSGFPGRMSVQPISNEDTDLEQLSDFEILSNMSSPVLSAFSDVMAPVDDKSDELLSSPDDVTPEETSFLWDVTSFLPFIKLLPNVTISDNQYYVDGPMVMTELERFAKSTRRIKQFTLADYELPTYDGVPTNNITIASETLIRLGKLEDPTKPFLSSLERLCLINADHTLLYIFSFCIIPSLKFLEIAGVPAARQISISSFLKELVFQVPCLPSLALGPGHISATSLRTSLKFTHLRHLRIDDAAESLNFDFLRGIAALPELESLMIDARTTEYEQRQNLSDADTEPFSTTVVTEPSAMPFPRLHKLALIANVLLIGDIVYSLFPRAVKDISLTLVQNGNALQLSPQWDRTKTESAAPIDVGASDSSADLEPSASVPYTIQIPADLLEETERQARAEVDRQAKAQAEQRAREEAERHAVEEAKRCEAEERAALQREAERREAERRAGLSEAERQAIDEEAERCKAEDRKAKRKARKKWEAEQREAEQWEAERRAGLSEAERVAERVAEAAAIAEAEAAAIAKAEAEEARKINIASQTSLFAYIIEEIFSIGFPDSFMINHLDMVSNKPNLAEFPSRTFQMLLSCPSLKKLQLSCWALPPSVNEIFISLATTPHPPMSMEMLQLPVDEASNTGVEISTLRLISFHYPCLTDFQCSIKPLCFVSAAQLGDNSIPYGLKYLSTGGKLPSSMQDKIAIATHIHLLFPGLEDIVIKKERWVDVDGWRLIKLLVRAHQEVSLVEEKRRASVTARREEVTQ